MLLFGRKRMPNLTTLTPGKVREHNTSDVVRAILGETPDASTDQVIKEVSRLTRHKCSTTLVYQLRSKLKTGAPSNNGATTHPPTAVPAAAASSPEYIDEAVQRYFKVREFVKGIGGVEKMRAYLDLIEM